MNVRRASFASFSSFPRLAACCTPALFVLACGGAPPPPPAPPPSAPVAVAPEQPVDLSAVPEPENLVLFARLAKPSEALKVIGGWTKMPMFGPDSVANMVTGDDIAGLVDLDKPIDFALEGEARGMSVKPRAAIAVAVKSMDAAKAALAKYKLTPAANGALRIEGLGAGAADDDGPGPRVCELAPAYGAAPARLVCSDGQAGLDAIAPYLTRTAPRTTFPSDVHLELRVGPVRPAVEKGKRAAPLILGTLLGIHRGAMPAVDAAFTAGVADLVDLVADTEKVAIDAMLADPQGTATLTASFRSTNSFIARLAAGHPERAAAPPDTFWRLPGDADAAYFHRGIDAGDFASPRDHVVALFGGAAQSEGLTAEADRKALEAVASHTLDLLAMPSVYAKGVDVASAQKALAALKGVKAGDAAARVAAERTALEEVAGWTVVGVDAPPANVAKVVKEWPTALSRPGVAKWLKAQSKDAPPPVLANAALPKGLTLGKDGAHLTLTIARPRHVEKGKAAPPLAKPIVLHVLVAPDTDGARTWIVFAADEATLIAKAKGLLTPDASSLAKHGGFEAMREAKINAGGFVSPRGLADGLTFSWLFGQDYEALQGDVFGGMTSSPQAGATPVPFTFTAQSGGSPGGAFVAQVTVPRAAIEDIVRVAMH